MPTETRLEQRLAAVERAVVDGDTALDDLEDLSSLADDVTHLESRLETDERRIADLEGRTDALSGFVGSVESVNEAVEQQADAAVAAVDRLEYRIDELERRLDSELHDADPHDVDSEPVVLERTRANEREDRSRDENETAFEFGTDSSIQSSNRSTDGCRLTDIAASSATPERTASDILSRPDESDSNSETTDDALVDGESDETSAGLLASVRSRLP